jgi:hypothetical protein
MRPSHLLLACPLLVLALAPAGTSRPAEEPPARKADDKPPDLVPPTAKDLAEKKMAFMKAATSRYSVRVGDRKEESKAADPCLRWADPVSNATDGVIAVYAHDGGRPDAVVQFFHNFQKRWIVEFTIIPDRDVTVLLSGREHWKPTEFVCAFADLPDAPAPAATPVARLSQMRTLAANFAVVDYFGVQEQKVDLRLLSQPAYRYAEAGKIVDGAMFVFAHGTNPEACVLIEAYPDGKVTKYRYAVAPMSIYKLEARYKGTPVWTVPRRHAGFRNAKSYYAEAYTPELGEVVPE